MNGETHENIVIIVGAGPAGLATAACLNILSIPNIILERHDCCAPLWRNQSYDRLSLHLAKQFCELPHMPYPATYPTYLSRSQFIQYLDDYIAHFNITPMYGKLVESAIYDEVARKWVVKVRKNTGFDEVEEYIGGFLVVATGESSDAFVPEVEGLRTFEGEVLHSTQYKNGQGFRGKNVLVVGSGNSGMEIAFDLSNYGANVSLTIRSPVHIVSRDAISLGLTLMKYLSSETIDKLMVMGSKLIYGDLSKYGIHRPKDGPFFLKDNYGKYPVVDVGTVKKIKSGEIKVMPGVRSIESNNVVFENGSLLPFEAIVFATGFRRSTNKWLQGDEWMLKEDGSAKQSYPNHWKGKNGLYCAGMARKGLYGINMDAQSIANDINSRTSIFTPHSA